MVRSLFLTPFARLIAIFRDAAWLNAERGRGYGFMTLVVMAGLACAWIGTSHNLIAPGGMPLGADFLSFYAASRLMLAGHAPQAWMPAIHHAAETRVLNHPFGYLAFFYPPAYLLVCAPLSLLPYGLALLAWSVGTTSAVVAVLRRWLAVLMPQARGILWVLLAFPALWINLGNGQNAALTTAILGGGFLLIDRRPIMAGLILGLMVIKPQLVIALPFVLLASGRWKTLLAAAFSAITISALAWIVVGTSGYTAFLADSVNARATLNLGLVDPGEMQSVFAAFKLLHIHNFVAYGAQILTAIAIISLACFAARQRLDGRALGALTVTSGLLATPFVLDYDLLTLALPLGWLVMTGCREGFKTWEKTVAVMGFFLPLFARWLAMSLHIPLSPLVVLAAFAIVMRRVCAKPLTTVTPERSAQMPAATAHP